MRLSILTLLDHERPLALGGDAWFLGDRQPLLTVVVLARLTGFVQRIKPR
ncbi:hypothetical protein [Rhizobium changzhiense]|uniref:Uncharacterized protein n=1 Tax=Rhizobium changzhiense TaxID=2692317 RepID=A0ABR6AGW8_9HYPH|nr:hypothetical protein [Rhizobium changzhiense]MBA5805876.1 hypothetical protein [Rhizobium changzhiense]